MNAGTLISIWLFSVWVDAGPAIPPNNLGYPVHISDKARGELGSGFYLRTETGAFFLVTAKHVLYSSAGVLASTEPIALDSVPVGIKSRLPAPEENVRMVLDIAQLESDDQIKAHPIQDVALIRLGLNGASAVRGIKGLSTREGLARVQVAISSLKMFKDVIAGNDAIVYGYPSSIGLRDIPQIDYDKPLLRRGNIAWKNNKAQTITLAIPVYPGNSGGPVVEMEWIDTGNIEHKVIGIISQRVPYAHEVLSLNPGTATRTKSLGPAVAEAVLENSGYSIVSPADAIIEVVKQFK